MTIELSESERTLLSDLLEIAFKEKLRETHHTATSAYRQGLEQEIAAIEELMNKLKRAGAAGPRS